MFKALVARARQGYRTAAYPLEQPHMPPLFRGRPVFLQGKCPTGCTACSDVCPSDAIKLSAAGPQLDLGRCIFCGDCATACPENLIHFTRDWRLSASDRAELLVGGKAEPRVQALRNELRLKGVEREIVEEVVDGEHDEELALRAGRKKALLLLQTPEMDYAKFRNRLGGFLQRRGFSYDVVSRVVRALWQELKEEDADLE